MDIKLMPKQYNEQSRKVPRRDISGSGFLYKIGLWSKVWMTLSFIILILAVLISLGLWIYKLDLNKQKNELTQEIERLNNQRDLALEDESIELARTLDVYKSVLDKKIYPSGVFTMLEEITLPKVQLSDFSLDLSLLKASFGIKADIYQTLVKQVIVFKKDPRIKEVQFSEVSFDDSGNAVTSLTVDLYPTFIFLNQ